jgi:hypothetical protein
VLSQLSRWSLLLALAMVAGCGSSDKPEQCSNEDRPGMPSVPDTALHWARITIRNVTAFDANGAKTVTNSILADFIDNTEAYNVQRQESTLGIAGPGCYGLSGKTVKTCQPGQSEPCTVKKLEVDKVEVLGLPGGAMTLIRSGEGAYSIDNLPDPLFGKGPVTARITSRNETGLFPSMELQVTQPDPLALSSPVLDPTGKPLPASDIKIKWTAGNGGVVAVVTTRFPTPTLTPGQIPPPDLQCVTTDDGCTTLVLSDMDQFDHTVGRQFKLQVIRDITTVGTNQDKTVALELKAVSEVDMVLAR